jgi:RNA polymerase sigma-70 factor (ECF subfamily)
MGDEDAIGELIRRVRRGDERAAAELVERFEPLIRQRVRIGLRMQDGRLRRVFDSMDICQSVLASFFVRAAAGQYDLEEPGQLVALLSRMARNKLSHRVAEQQAMRRDVRRAGGDDPGLVAAGDPGPERQAAGRDLLAELRRRLGPEERRIAERRAEGAGWAEIAAELGGTGEARRKQLVRALDRVASELGLDDGLAGELG